jgi:pimeloyl-ACP methyl ester carboxylesterase
VLATFERLGGSRARRAAAAWLDDPSAESVADYLRDCLSLYKRSAMDPDVMRRAVVDLETTIAFFRGEWRTFDFLPVLSRVRCPTLVMSGDADPITPFEDGEELAAALPASVVRFERFAGYGHPVYEDDEAACFGTIKEFLARHA